MFCIFCSRIYQRIWCISSLQLKQNQRISGGRTHFHLPSTINLHQAVTNFPISLPDRLMGRSRHPSLYLSQHTALSVIYLTSTALPRAGEPGTGRESLVLTELSVYICVLKVHVRCCSCKEVTNYGLAQVPGTAQKNHLCDKG